MSTVDATRSITNRAARGFTLIELVTTLALIGILGVIAIPRMFDNSTFAERGYVDEVASALREAQRIAQASDCAVRITINPADYSAVQRDTLPTCNSAGAWALPVLRGDGSRLQGNAPSDVAMAPVTTIEFARDGSVPAGAPPILSVGTFTIAIDPFSGAVTVTP